MQKHCDNCGRDTNPTTGEQLRLKEVTLADESGKALYCDDCRKNNDRKEVEARNPDVPKEIFDIEASDEIAAQFREFEALNC